MPRLLYLLPLCLLLSLSAAATEPIAKDCRCKGVPLRGKVRVVDAFETFTVRVVSSNADLNVRWVTAFPDNCGEWQLVDAFEDFTIRYVSANEDFTISTTSAFPGLLRFTTAPPPLAHPTKTPAQNSAR